MSYGDHNAASHKGYPDFPTATSVVNPAKVMGPMVDDISAYTIRIQNGDVGVGQQWLAQASKKKHAYSFLEVAVKEMKDRAAQRDKCDQNTPGLAGERSMAATIRAFNALTGHNLTEAEGWEFMILLKLVRGRQGDFRMDDYVDAAAYCGLLGECESQAR